MRKVVLVIVLFFSVNCLFSEENKYFFYIPSTEEMQSYFSMKNYLSQWDAGKRVVDDLTFDKIYRNNIGKETINSLLLESFFRNTRNAKIRQQLKQYIKSNKIDSSFSKAIVKKIDSKLEKEKTSEKEVWRYNYDDKEFDENINLFNFREAGVFNNKLGMLLFDNDWNQISFSQKEKTSEDKFFLIYGGGTNSITINFYEKNGVKREDLDVAMNQGYYKNRHPNNWQSIELEREGILWNCGADKYIIAFGSDPESNSATFNAYLYDEKEKRLYLMSTSMNFSKINMFYSERYRIYNYLLFNSLFCFINKK